MPRVPGTVVDEGLIADVFKALPLEDTALVPLSILAALEEGPFVLRFAEADAVVAHDEAKIHRHVLPLRRSMPPTCDSDQDIPPIPHADALMILFALAALSRAEIDML